MPQIFHPSMNTLSRLSVFGAVFLVTAATLIAAALVRSPYSTEAGVIEPQPVPFSHQHHVADVGIDCRYCHLTVEAQAFAGIPATEICMDCHSQLFTDSSVLRPVRESYRRGTPLEWVRVHDLPDFVYFHHGIHVQKGVACRTCHGEVDQMPLMWQSQTMLMQWCLNCHRNPQQHVDRGRDVFTMASSPAATPAAMDTARDTLTLHSRMDCSICHR